MNQRMGVREERAMPIVPSTLFGDLDKKEEYWITGEKLLNEERKTVR